MAIPMTNSSDTKLRLKVSDILDEAQALVECKACPWYKSCVLPMRFTEEDLRKQLESSLPGVASPGSNPVRYTAVAIRHGRRRGEFYLRGLPGVHQQASGQLQARRTDKEANASMVRR